MQIMVLVIEIVDSKEAINEQVYNDVEGFNHFGLRFGTCCLTM